MAAEAEQSTYHRSESEMGSEKTSHITDERSNLPKTSETLTIKRASSLLARN